MYKANPRVNEELRQRLPSPGRSPRTPLGLSPPRTPRSPPPLPHQPLPPHPDRQPGPKPRPQPQQEPDSQPDPESATQPSQHQNWDQPGPHLFPSPALSSSSPALSSQTRPRCEENQARTKPRPWNHGGGA